MKKVLLFFLLFNSISIFGQNNYSIGYTIKNSSGISINQSNIENRVQSVIGSVNQHPGSSTIYLVVNILGVEYGKIEGIKVKTTAKLTQQWSLVDNVLNKTLDSKQFTFTGTGDSENLAIQNANTQISQNNKNIRTWLEKRDDIIQNYYLKSCDELTEKAKKYHSSGGYLNAFMILDALPMTSDCYIKNKELRNSYLQTLQKKECESTQLQVQSLQASGKYEQAVNTLIYSTSNDPNCFESLKGISRKLIDAMGSEYKENRENLIKWQNQVFEIEKESAKFSKKLIEEYYKNSQILFLNSN